ncbi:UDP-N-acetyl glucosamine 2-epimerase [Aquiluna sp.]|nr:UDP-N-acetyl glucosamine 2-epimerase [Aquiluna sp.]
MTVVGTRPEIIRLSRLIPLLDRHFEHTLVFAGQNSDPKLSDIFFEDLGIRAPDLVWSPNNNSLASTVGSILVAAEKEILRLKPDGMVVLGDTNSGLALLMARRYGVTTYHLEAGNRSFDSNVPEEVNRRLLDHVADYNLPYNDFSFSNLVAEGIHPSTMCITGSPLPEVFDHYKSVIENSNILTELSLQSGNYIVASLHRQENVDRKDRLTALLTGLHRLSEHLRIPVVISLHPRTKMRMQKFGLHLPETFVESEPFGYPDFCRLQKDARIVVSDSGTLSEEAELLSLVAISPRPAFERPEGLESAKVLLSEPEHFVSAAQLALSREQNGITPRGYSHVKFSDVVAGFIMSTIATHASRTGLLRLDV